MRPAPSWRLACRAYPTRPTYPLIAQSPYLGLCRQAPREESGRANHPASLTSHNRYLSSHSASIYRTTRIEGHTLPPRSALAVGHRPAPLLSPWRLTTALTRLTTALGPFPPSHAPMALGGTKDRGQSQDRGQPECRSSDGGRSPP